MNSKRLFKKMLSLFLVLMLALCTLGTGVLADDEGGGGESPGSESVSVDTDSGNSGDSSSADTPSDTPESGGSDAESGSGSSDGSGDPEDADQPADADKTGEDAGISENQEGTGGDLDGDSEKTVNKDENSQQNSDNNVTNTTIETPADGAAEDTSDKKATEEKTKDSAESTDNGKEQSDEDENKKSWLGSISDAVSGTVSNIKESVSETVSDIISDSFVADIFPSLASLDSEDDEDEEESGNMAPRISDSDYIYFDLALGDVTINDSSISGYVYDITSSEDGSETVTYSSVAKTYSSSDEKYSKNIYIYQSNGSPDNSGSTWKGGLPVYERVTVGSKTWGDYITNNTGVQGVISAWDTAVSAVGRTATEHYVTISGDKDFNITIDNLYSKAQVHSNSVVDGNGGIICERSSQGKTVISMKGDNRFGRIHYHTNKDATETSLTFKDADGDGGSATLTAANIAGNAGYNHWNSAIGSIDIDSKYENAVGLVFESGIIYAGTTSEDNCSAIGAGGNGYGEITITGGTVTAVTSSTGTAIGGGIGESSKGGEGKVTISGGEVYAYNLGKSLDGTYIPAAAIGGGSSKSQSGSEADVTITGGEVYAQSLGGTAIGGGGSATMNGGDVKLTISGNADVTAKSVGDESKSISAGAGIGGGTGKTNGGSATVTIEGGNVKTGSIGGGSGETSLGSATVNISGGTVQGQVVMSGGTGSTAGSFTMSDGTIDNSGISGYNPLKTDGGALHIENGTATISGGTIENCTAVNGGNGGAVYINYSGSSDSTTNAFEMTGGTLANNTATVDGGAVYVTSDSSNVSVLIEGGKITGNKAVNGGGVAVVPANSHTANVVIGKEDCNGGSDGEHSGSHPDISNNTASGTGGGVYISGSGENSSNVTMYCGEIASNTLANSTSNDVTQTGGTFTNAGGTIKKDPTVTGGEYNDTSASGGSDEVKVYYKVVYHANKSTGDTETIEVKISEPAGTETETDHTWNAITLPGSNQFTKANCYISGWSISGGDDASAEYKTGEEVTLHSLIPVDGSAESTTVEGSGTESRPYIINFYAVWAQEAVAAGSEASYVVTIPAALSIGGFESPAKGTVSATLTNFKHDNWLNVTVSSKNTYTLVDSRSESNKLLYLLYLDDSSSATNSDDSVVVATSEEEDTVQGLKNGDSVLVFKEKSTELETLTQGITAQLRSNDPVTVAGTYTDILTFTVNFK